ncbi:MAG: hypothetical protein H6822_35310 [Planctomycetaceae bacterium]|nr:hypothetical protein [Planctomycetales bacterium]MCB9927456.1 hypothetical protein [Planctomycetaceae bacterium]
MADENESLERSANADTETRSGRADATTSPTIAHDTKVPGHTGDNEIHLELLKRRLDSQETFVGHFIRGCMFFLIIAGLIFNFAFDKKLDQALLIALTVTGFVWGLIGLVMCIASRMAVRRLDEDVVHLNDRIGSPLVNPKLYYLEWAIIFCACFDVGYSTLMVIRFFNIPAA